MPPTQTPVPIPNIELPPIFGEYTNHVMILGILLLFGLPLIAGIIQIAKLFTKRRSIKQNQQEELYPYKHKKSLLTKAEQDFYHVLTTVTKGQITICPQIPLGALFYPDTRDASKNRGYYNRINRRWVDFVLCDPTNLKPLAAIELDDKSHNRPDRKKRDILVENVFKSANLPLIRIPVQPNYAPLEIKRKLQEAKIEFP